mmetsp:Transcript_112474/g.363191  ORF Transcript_112474/g.363191 Transcript_112474/m.363191 type:complete len:327 (+) Transcript_112474:513-1493(+)
MGWHLCVPLTDEGFGTTVVLVLDQVLDQQGAWANLRVEFETKRRRHVTVLLANVCVDRHGRLHNQLELKDFLFEVAYELLRRAILSVHAHNEIALCQLIVGFPGVVVVVCLDGTITLNVFHVQHPRAVRVEIQAQRLFGCGLGHNHGLLHSHSFRVALAGQLDLDLDECVVLPRIQQLHLSVEAAFFEGRARESALAEEVIRFQRILVPDLELEVLPLLPLLDLELLYPDGLQRVTLDSRPAELLSRDPQRRVAVRLVVGAAEGTRPPGVCIPDASGSHDCHPELRLSLSRPLRCRGLLWLLLWLLGDLHLFLQLTIIAAHGPHRG